MIEDKKNVAEKEVVNTTDGVYTVSEESLSDSWSPEVYTVNSQGVIPSGTNIGLNAYHTTPIDFGADAGKGFENFKFEDYVQPKLFEDALPSMHQVSEMCEQYPSLKIAFDKFKNIFVICYNDYICKNGKDQF